MIQAWIAKLQAWIAVSAVALVIGAGLGAGAVVLWDYKAPFGLGLGERLDKANVALGKATADLKACRGDVTVLVGKTWEWKGVYDRLEARREKEAADATKALTDRTAAAKAQCRSAFDAGLTAGRALGPSEESKDASSQAGGGGRPDGAGGVRNDLRTAWGAAAFRPDPGR